MNSRGALLTVAMGIGMLLTFVFTGAAYYVHEAGVESATRILSWPNTLLQNLIPCNNIGTVEQPFCEGTPLNFIAYVASFPLSVTVYATAAFVILRRRLMATSRALGRTREG